MENKKIELVTSTIDHFPDILAFSEGIYDGFDYIKQVKKRVQNY